MEDLVISVHTEGGGIGGNIWWQDIFFFINVNVSYRLVNVISDKSLFHCNYRSKRIKNNFIYGVARCHAYDDPRCCPSLEYKTKIAFENNSPVAISMKRVK